MFFRNYKSSSKTIHTNNTRSKTSGVVSFIFIKDFFRNKQLA
ncbi:hypothetical protein EZBTHKR_3003 [Elizabethkingia anophelis]|nr:hypothetical protein EZBTHKR_3003 [Elizabethkingia anophelis]